MVKTTKRARKFEAKGGVKTRLDKGTVTKKGKLKFVKKRRREEDAENANKKKQVIEEDVGNEESIDYGDDLGGLEVDDFFTSITEGDGDDDVDSVGDKEQDEDGNKDSDASEDDDEEDYGDSDIDSGNEEDIMEAEKRMKLEMEDLAKTDPEFHEYLQKNDDELLQFQEGEEEEELDGEEENMQEEMDIDTARDEPKGEKDLVKVVNTKLLATYERGAFQSRGLKALKRMVSVYRAACHMADTEDKSVASKVKYQIESTTVFNRVVAVCMTRCHEEFHYHLLGDNAPTSKKNDDEDRDEEMEENIEQSDINKPIKPQQLVKSPKWEDLQSSITSFMKATMYLISESKETKLINFVLKSLQHYIQYMSALPKLEKIMLKSLVSLWSSTTDASPQEYQPVRLNAFLRIRQMTMTQPFPFIEHCLKACYLAYAKCAKFGNAARASSVLPTLAFMGNCVVELYSLDYASSYQHAFVYIRQLALHLRTAMQKKTPETFRVVYCWQYIHCLKLWTAVLSSCCTSEGVGDDETQLLRSLVYPLVEVITGVIKLVPTARHLPLRLHCVRYLQQLAAATESYIPTTSILLDALDLKEMTMPPKRIKSRGKDVRGLNLSFLLKLPKENTLRSSEQLDACLNDIFLLFNREVDLYRYSAGFPEFAVRICQKLRKFLKEMKNGKYRAYAKGCIELSGKYSKAALSARSKLQEAPKDIKRLEVLKPNNMPSMSERYESSVEKEKRSQSQAIPKLVAPAAEVSKKTKTNKEKQEKDAPSSTSNKHVNKRTKLENKRGDMKPKLDTTELKDINELEDDVQEGVNWSDSE